MPSEDVQSWSPTAVNNGTADSGINWIEGMPRADVNNSARSMMAAIAKDRNLKNGSIVTAGTPNAQTFSSGLTPPYTTIPTGMRVKLKIGAALTNTDAATLSMDSITPVAVKDNNGFPVGAGAMLAGAYLDFLYDGTVWILLNDQSAAGIVPQSGRLTVTSSSTLAFLPFNGDLIKINGQFFRIPTTGIVGLVGAGGYVNGVAGSTVASDTLYYVYAFSNAGVVTADFRTGGHATSVTPGNVGVETLVGDDSRTLIGMVRTWGSSFVADSFRKLCISWFNRRNICSTGQRIQATTSGGPTELSSNARAHFLAWGDEAVHLGLFGSTRHQEGPGFSCYTSIGIDGPTNAFSVVSIYDALAANAFVPVAASGAIEVAEGFHYATPLAGNNGGTALWDMSCTAMTRG